jgi:hypothetical protein
MAVSFTTTGYGNTYSSEGWATAHPTIGLATYGVRSPADWKVSAVPGQDRTVSIAAGRGFGGGVTDKTVDAETLQLDPVESGSRWDIVACRRNWGTATSSFSKVNGGPNMGLTLARESVIGNIDEQPLALVRVTAGEQVPSEIIDLRTWSGDGGGIVAAHELVKSFLNKTGTRLNINGVDWVRRVGADGNPEWVDVSKTTLHGIGGALVGTAPANGSGVLIQTGTIVQVTDPAGLGRVTFPAPFPGGLISVMGSNGDATANGSGVTFESAGSIQGQSGFGSKTDWVYQMVSPAGSRIPNKLHRLNWIAIGW